MTLGQNTPGRELRTRYLGLGLSMVGGLLVLAVNLYRLQITRGDEYVAKSQANFIKENRVPADRGMIRDSRGEILVDNRPSFNVMIRPAFCQKCTDEVLPKLSAWLEWDATFRARVEQQLKDAWRTRAEFQPLTVHVDVTRDQYDLLNAHKLSLPGVEVASVPHRSYRLGPVLAHVLGYMNEINKPELERLNAGGADYALGDYIGRRGLERYFETRLRGKDGVRREVVNARGEPDPEFSDLIRGGDRPSAPGHNLVLSIDLRLQETAERVFPGIAGAVIAMDVRTGFILAVVSRPSFDPNLLTGRITPQEMAKLSKDPLQPMIFRAVSQHYSPGSTFKPITALAALRSGLFSTKSQVTCTGGYRLGSRTWRCWNDRGHGVEEARGALQHSCDTYYYRVADVLGLEPIAQVGKELGLGQPTGIGVVAEVPGIMPDVAYHDRVTPGGYTKGMALNSAIGQGDVNVTPLQLAMVYAAIANGGAVYRPQLVKQVETVEGALVQRFEPQLHRDIHIHPEHRRVVIDALSAVVNEAGGTAYRSRLKDVKIAGKTGTAQVARLGQVRLKTEQMAYWLRDHAWFASFAPADEPEIAVVVLNEHGGHGGSDAAPTASAVIQKYFDLKAEDQAASVEPRRDPARLGPVEDLGPSIPFLPASESAPWSGSFVNGGH